MIAASWTASSGTSEASMSHSLCGALHFHCFILSFLCKLSYFMFLYTLERSASFKLQKSYSSMKFRFFLRHPEDFRFRKSQMTALCHAARHVWVTMRPWLLSRWNLLVLSVAALSNFCFCPVRWFVVLVKKVNLSQLWFYIINFDCLQCLIFRADMWLSCRWQETNWLHFLFEFHKFFCKHQSLYDSDYNRMKAHVKCKAVTICYYNSNSCFCNGNEKLKNHVFWARCR